MPGLDAAPGVLRLAAACAALHAAEASVDAEAAARLGASVPIAEATAAVARAPGVRFPISFSSQEAEVNFIALLALLAFGSGWDAELRATGERRRPAGDGAADLALRGLFALHISGRVRCPCPCVNKLNADALCALSEHDVAQAWGLPLTRDVPVAGCAAATVAEDHPLRPFLRSLRFALADTGRRLWERRAESLGALLLTLAAPLLGGGGAPSGAALAEALAAALPAFADEAPPPNAAPDTPPLHFRAKALRLVADLHRRYSAEDPARFAFADIAALPAPADAALVAALRRCGAVRVSPSLAERLTADALLPPGGREEVALRSAAVAAAAAACAASPGGALSPMQLSFWLAVHGGGGVDGAADVVPLHRVRDTVFY